MNNQNSPEGDISTAIALKMFVSELRVQKTSMLGPGGGPAISTHRREKPDEATPASQQRIDEWAQRIAGIFLMGFQPLPPTQTTRYETSSTRAARPRPIRDSTDHWAIKPGPKRSLGSGLTRDIDRNAPSPSFLQRTYK